MLRNKRADGREGLLWGEMAVQEDEAALGNAARLHGGEGRSEVAWVCDYQRRFRDPELVSYTVPSTVEYG